MVFHAWVLECLPPFILPLLRGGLYKQRKVIQQCCFGRGGEVVRGEMERCRRGAGEVLKRCWRGVGKLLDKC